MDRISIGRENAIEIAESKAWEKWPLKERAWYQLHVKELMMPFDKFHEAVEALMDRPVWTHEFADMQFLIDELEGNVPKADMADIIEKLFNLVGGK